MAPMEFMGVTFSTKSSFKQAMKNLIYEKIGVCYNIKETHPVHYETLMGLIQRHPDYHDKSRDMCDMRIVPNRKNKNSLELQIIKTDGSAEAISWQIAISGKSPTPREELARAMRNAIYDQIAKYKTTQNQVCELCHSDGDIHCDHVTHFAKLAADFIDIYGEEPSKFRDGGDGMRDFLKCDSGFKQAWIDYHKTHADLRILCVRCNLTRPKWVGR